MASEESDRLLTRRTTRTMTELILSLLRAYFDDEDALFLDCSKLVDDPTNPSTMELQWIASWNPCDEIVIGGTVFTRQEKKGDTVTFCRPIDRWMHPDEVMRRRDAVRDRWTDKEREARAVKKRVDWQLLTHNDSNWELPPMQDVDILVM